MYRLLALLLLVVIAAPAASAPAHFLQSGPPQIEVLPDSVRLRWHGDPAQLSGTTGATFGETVLPVYQFAFRMSGDGPITPQLDQISSRPWTEALPTISSPSPRSSTGAPRPELAASEASFPTAPVIVLREGRLNGLRIAVVAVSPIFEQEGSLRAATALVATITGLAPIVEGAIEPGKATLAAAPAPRNPLAGRSALTIIVEQAGIQRITAAGLAEAGLATAITDPARLWLRHRGVAVPLEQIGSGEGLELRFFAPAPGDRWNRTDIYWLSLEETPGPRIATRDVTPGQAPPRSIALERGSWQINRLYDSTLPGPDGDHWYAADLRTAPDQPAATFALTLTGRLPPVAGPLELTLQGAAYTRSIHTLQVATADASTALVWSGRGNWQQQAILNSADTRLSLALLPGAAADGVELDTVLWQRPVVLDLQGRGAIFGGATGIWRYQLERLPAAPQLYDITLPGDPVRLTGLSNAFQDSQEQRWYLVTGEGTFHTPALAAHTPTDLASPLNAHVLYLAPAEFHTALAPLVAWRQSQGHSVAVVDVQAIYDHWSYGSIAPAAIRDFLRYAAAWPVAPTTVVLVGDGTVDPHNYAERGERLIIPPYMAMVDPWLGETACDTCYVQLDGDDPLADSLPDMAIGRFPVKNVTELADLVAKIVRFEQHPPEGRWRNRAIYLADDADNAGDFAALSEKVIGQLPAEMEVRRAYYAPGGGEGREGDPLRVRAQALAFLDDGAAIATFTGHGSPFQWAVTGPPLQPDQPVDQQYLLSLYDADSLANNMRLPVVLAMTCLTSAFQTPAFSGTTIDERLVLAPNGGAIAVWGSTGQGVAHGHDFLQYGFFRSLREASTQGRAATLGELVRSGQAELFTGAGCCQDILRTFVLLGDPLTPVRIGQQSGRISLPIIYGPVP